VAHGPVGASLRPVASVRLVLKALCVEQDRGDLVRL
jgi:hypothetical protein